ncbi:MAG: 1,6-anhydro-N-acetylmuramyl-L-alanine amidase AmpD, partial [Gammaproteobacteria bacterium]|nr:1,6-anhydro-N-acetylmuramyl-L-alanine amidase AmpD [Gammaproteobacteria bacterium]
SSFQGRENCNDFSIGVELEGTDDLAYTDEQYKSLNNLKNILQKNFPLIKQERICGHSDIAPERKTDPGIAFDWLRIQ